MDWWQWISMDARNRTLQRGDFYPSRLLDIKEGQTRPRSRSELVCFQETDIVQVSKCEWDKSSRDYRLFKIHRVTKQVEQFAIEELCVRHSVTAEKPSVEENSEGSWIVEVLKMLFHLCNCKRTPINPFIRSRTHYFCHIYSARSDSIPVMWLNPA
jgi:hypothetical protein